MQEEEDAFDEDGLLRDVALRSEGEEEEDDDARVVLLEEDDEEEIELQRRRREEMRRESFVGERDGEDASLLAGEGARRGESVAGLSLADFSRKLSGGRALLEDEEVGGGEESPSPDINWGGLSEFGCLFSAFFFPTQIIEYFLLLELIIFCSVFLQAGGTRLSLLPSK